MIISGVSGFIGTVPAGATRGIDVNHDTNGPGEDRLSVLKDELAVWAPVGNLIG
jgi:hypothetical protein